MNYREAQKIYEILPQEVKRKYVQLFREHKTSLIPFVTEYVEQARKQAEARVLKAKINEKLAEIDSSQIEESLTETELLGLLENVLNRVNELLENFEVLRLAFNKRIDLDENIVKLLEKLIKQQALILKHLTVVKSD